MKRRTFMQALAGVLGLGTTAAAARPGTGLVVLEWEPEKPVRAVEVPFFAGMTPREFAAYMQQYVQRMDAAAQAIEARLAALEADVGQPVRLKIERNPWRF